MHIEPFQIAVDDHVLVDLQQRLNGVRLPNTVSGIGWDQGTDRSYLVDVLDRWRNGYNWRAQEAELNRWPQVLTEVDGQLIHAMHARSPHAKALPLLLCHGWPGSVVEFLDVFGPLTDPPDPADAFHVVAPSLPGYAWSGPTHERGWHPRRIAKAFVELMAGLGYDRFGAQGGDWGSVVSANVADICPERVAGLHMNLAVVAPPKGRAFNAEEQRALDERVAWEHTGSGYQDQQSTRPQSLGYGLEDSPTGLAAWILEKFHAWSEDPTRFDCDRLLTNVMAYWVTGTATSSLRLYWELRQAGAAAVPRHRVEVPTGIANFPAEVLHSPRSWVERRYNVTHWTHPLRGGHFAAMEVPDVFVDDVRTFFATVRRVDS